MMFKAIEAICKANKTIMLADINGTQWISDGGAAYPLHGLPILDEGNVFTIFDIPEDKRDKFLFNDTGSFAENPSFEDTEPGEMVLEQGGFALYASGRILIPLKTGSGLVFINNRHLAPFSDSDQGVTLNERTDKSGRTYIAVKDGFLLAGIIYPVNVITKELVHELDELHKLALIAALNSTLKEEPEQTSLGDYEEQEEEDK